MSLARCINGHMYSTRKHGTTCPYCNVSMEQTPKVEPKKSVNKMSTVSNTNDDAKTMAYWDDRDGIEPVVGWLVCIEGAQRGQDYRIRTEKNFIGRSEEMHIQINGDNGISRRNHAIISYNPIQRNFFLIPGDGAGLVYHNNEAVYTPVELTAYDVIQMGKSKFLFIPLCGIHFEWENDEKKEW
ncbi:MAG: FHA domain-containing protein [Clostridia bacterium]|nr:FHA domain-containing protein [Clostridia bacterium]